VFEVESYRAPFVQLYQQELGGKAPADLGSYAGYIRGTSTVTGLSVKAFLDEGFYARGRKVTAEDFEGLKLKAHTVCPKWNYTLHPRNAGNKGWE
jgi:hypothetical protein